jgi:hypothetical protein
MKAASITEIKKELKTLSHQELMEHCLRMAKFKKDCKELLTYLLFESEDEASFVRELKEHITGEFGTVNNQSPYWAKKSIRKLLRLVNKYIRYSGKKETKVEVLLHFCREMLELRKAIRYDYSYDGIYMRQKVVITKTITYLHEDLQYDYQLELEELPDFDN